MLTLLFWNTAGKPVQKHLVRLATTHSVDVMVLAESRSTTGAVATHLNNDASGEYYASQPAIGSRLIIYTRLPESRITALSDMPHLALRRIQMSEGQSILVAAVHLRSKLFASSQHQRKLATDVIDEIVRYEDGPDPLTILIGDLNMNPWEDGVVSADALHGVMSRRDARSERTVGNRSYPVFYNPMWGLLGDRGSRAPGTFRRADGDASCLFWHMYDQVLMRPGLIGHFDEETLEVLCTDGQQSLLTQQGNPQRKISDHLPIVVRFRI